MKNYRETFILINKKLNIYIKYVFSKNYIIHCIIHNYIINNFFKKIKFMYDIFYMNILSNIEY